MPDQPRPKFDPWARRSWTDLGPRLASAAVLVVVTIVALVLGGYVFAALVGAVFAGCYREWEQMVTLQPLQAPGGVLVGLVALSALVFPALGAPATLAVIVAATILALLLGGEGKYWRVIGIGFFGLVIGAVLAVRGGNQIGLYASLLLGSVVWLTDTGAYFTGRQVGGEKLAPDISPSKTWSGALGGFALGTLAGLILWLVLVPASPWWIGLLLAAALSVVGQVGDLIESAIKRRFRIKDSGDIIPGHGGLMDRLDSISFGVLVVVVVGGLHGGFDNISHGFLTW